MEEMIAYVETSACRRQFLLHYFGEEYHSSKCNNMCDNCKYPKEQVEVKDAILMAMRSIEQLNENYTVKILVEFITGKATKEMKDFRFDKLPLFGVGKDESELFWHSIFRHGILNNLILKEIEQYGVLKISEEGRTFLKKPHSITIPINRDFSDAEGDDFINIDSGGTAAVLDEVLMNILLDIRRKEGKRHNIQPWIIFNEPAIQDMATFYPMTMEEMLKISGVSQGKAQKYAKPFMDAIIKYIDENEIERPDDVIVKQVANKSKDKITIIQGIDRKLPFEVIARSVDMNYDDFLYELNSIVDTGLKFNIDYYIKDRIDEDIVEEIFEYFQEADSDSIEDAFKNMKDDDITFEEICLSRIKFMSEFVN
jgi:ATP-dependent DNA helicase RecQ